jgi:malic enzyme
MMSVLIARVSRVFNVRHGTQGVVNNMQADMQELLVRGPERIETTKRGIWLLKNPATNKGLAFSPEEREQCGLHGLLPATQHSIAQQVELELEHLRAKATALEKYIGLAGLLYRNEVLFYRVMVENISELMPIFYTPTVGEACQRFSHIVRDMRGIWLTPDDIDRMPDRLRNFPYQDIRLIVVTDNERILGLGDQGAGGMGIPVGKLALYVAGAGIHPSKVLPISLDLGTNNGVLLDDPLYVGYRARRITGRDYDDFIETFVESVTQVFPNAVLQWEDFHKRNAFHLLERYRRRLPCFNDDIQGTAGVTLAAVLAALRVSKQRLREQRVLFMGAGEACTGIARLLAAAMREDGAAEEDIVASRLTFDSRGLLHDAREMDMPHKAELRASSELLARLGLDPRACSPEAAIEALKPTILVGATAAPGTFTRSMIEAMARHVDRPIVLPLTNPTSKAECTPAEVLEWSRGRALVATGSPFADVQYEGKRHVIGQANNVFVFPGIGLGAILSGVREVDDSVFLVAARTLAEHVDESRLQVGALLPDQSALRTASAKIAAAIVRHASHTGRGRSIADEDVETLVEASMWYPDYVPVVCRPPRR